MFKRPSEEKGESPSEETPSVPEERKPPAAEQEVEYKSLPGYQPRRGVSITPGRITLSLGHTGAALLLLCILALVLASFALGVASGRKHTRITPQKLMSRAGRPPDEIIDANKVSTWQLNRRGVSPAGQGVPAQRTSKTSQTSRKGSAGRWTLQLISGIPEENAQKIAQDLRARGYDAVPVLAGKMSAVRVGSYDSPDSVGARQARALFQSYKYDGKKQFADCNFVKMK